MAEEIINDLDSQLEAERAKVTKLEADLAQAIADGEQRANNIDTELKAVKSALDKANSDNTELAGKLNDAIAECTTLKSDCAIKQRAINDLSSKIETNGRLMIERDRIVSEQTSIAARNAELNAARLKLEQQINS